MHQGQPVSHRTILQYNQMRRFVFEYLDTLSPNDMPVKELDKKVLRWVCGFSQRKRFQVEHRWEAYLKPESCNKLVTIVGANRVRICGTKEM